MKKIYSLVFGALLAMPAMAQEDMTHLIKNAGFDEDLTFTTDGGVKNITEKGSLSGRSHKWTAEDGTIYAASKTSAEGNGSWKRNDTDHSFNGFLGQIAGWTLATGSNGEWTYFGAVPYGVGETAIPIADDNNGSWLSMPGKPEGADTDDNKASMYLRAGWTNYATYSQTVSLPCAVYELEYWINNLNFASTDASGLENLCKITCRKEVFPDEDGINADGWTKHTIQFTPTSEFTIQMGFKAGNYGSGKNPILLIDGMKLWKIDEADEEEILKADLNGYASDLNEILSEDLGHYDGFVAEIEEYAEMLTDAADGGDIALMEKLNVEAPLYIEKVKGYLATIEEFKAALANAQAILEAASENPYPGYDAFEEKLGEFDDYLNDGLQPITGKTAIETVELQTENIQKAINDYYTSQEASEDNPADYTFLVDQPNFGYINEEGSVVAAQGKWYIGQEGGDQSIKTDKTDNDGNPIACWNAWRNTMEIGNSVSINQDLVGIPNGKYTVTADLNTQDGCITDQHVFAKGSADDAVSPVMTVTGWNPCVWETLTTAKVIVVDGKLTIGAIGNSDGETPEQHGGTDTDKRRGWFNMTNVKLNYLGEATAEEIAEVTAKKYAAAEEFANGMHLAADKAEAIKAIADAKAAQDLEALNEAVAAAEASETDYLQVVNGTYKSLQDSIAKYPEGNQTKVTKVVVDITTNYLNSAAATSAETGKYTEILRAYLNNLCPAINKVENTKAETEKGQAILDGTVKSVVEVLAALKVLPTTEMVQEQIDALNKALNVYEIADAEIKDGADLTVYIANPTVNDESGWTYNRPKGDKNTTTSQGVDGVGTNRYLDCWQSEAGTTRFTAYQVLNVPNGTYTISNIMRTSGAGAYLFASTKEPVMSEEDVLSLDPTATTVKSQAVAKATPYAKYGIIPEEEDPENEKVYTDSYGEIFMSAADRVMAAMGFTATEGVTIYDSAIDLNGGSEDCPANVDPYDWAVIGANAGKGRGWFNNSVDIEVKDHVLVLGISCDYVFFNDVEENKFDGTWFSADNFKLILNKVGDNTGWQDPATGISSVATSNASIQAVFSVSGARMNGLQKGINIVKMSNGMVQKIYVK